MAEAERTIGEMIKLAQELPDFSIIKLVLRQEKVPVKLRFIY